MIVTPWTIFMVLLVNFDFVLLFPSFNDNNYKISESSINNLIAGLSISQPQLKQLWTNLIAEKMATDGTYGEFVQNFL